MYKFSVKEILKNLAMNFFSYALPTVVLQFVVQPIIAKKLGADLNGQYLTLMSLNYFLIGISAAVLNTVRMLQNEKYEQQQLTGDFNLIFLGYAILLAIIMPLGYLFFVKTPSAIEIFLYLAIGLLYLYHDYIFAQYRLRMQFNKILINNVILVLGYCIGIAVFTFFVPIWQLVFIIPYTFSGVYDYINTDFIKEPITRTAFFRETIGKVGSLSVANSLNTSIAYFDKLLLYPLLGGLAVSVYNTASLVGKMLYLVSAPLNSLLLSYLVRIERFSISSIKKYAFKLTALLLLGYLACVAIGYPLTSFLYPQWSSEAQMFIPITVAANLFLLVGNLANTILVRYYKTSFQMTIQAINLFVYLIVCLSFLHFGGLLGFSIGVAIVAGIKMIILLIFIGKIDNSESSKRIT